MNIDSDSVMQAKDPIMDGYIERQVRQYESGDEDNQPDENEDQHNRLHPNIHPGSLQGCNRTFGYKSKMLRHFNVAHSQQQQEPSLSNANIATLQPRQGNVFVCQAQGCSKSYGTAKSLSNHNSKAHGAGDKALFRCHVEYCGRVYTSAGGLKYHMEAKHPADGDGKPFKCPGGNCTSAFVDQRQLKKHQANAHDIWRCTASKCIAEFSTNQELITHRANVHKKFPIRGQGAYVAQRTLAATASPSRGQISEAEESENEQSVQSEQESESKITFPCPADRCKFGHSAEWGIRKHWMAAHQGKSYPPDSWPTIKSNSDIQQDPFLPESSSSRLIARPGGIHYSQSPSTISTMKRLHPFHSDPSSTHLSQPSSSISNFKPEIEEKRPLPVSSLMDKRYSGPSRMKEEEQDTSLSMSKSHSDNERDTPPPLPRVPSPPTPTVRAPPKAPPPPKKIKPLSAEAFARMPLFNHQDPSRQLLPLKWPARVQEPDSSEDEDLFSLSEEETPEPVAKKNKRVTVGGDFDPFYNQDLSDSDMSRTPSPFAPFLALYSKPTSLKHPTHIDNVPAISPYGFLARHNLDSNHHRSHPNPPSSSNAKSESPKMTSGNPITEGIVASKMQFRIGQDTPSPPYQNAGIGFGWHWASQESEAAEAKLKAACKKPQPIDHNADTEKEVVMGFYDDIETPNICWIRRDKEMKAKAEEARIVEEKAREEREKAMEEEKPRVIIRRQRRKATCAGPPRVKRKYVWKNGGRRGPGEAAAAKKAEREAAEKKRAEAVARGEVVDEDDGGEKGKGRGKGKRKRVEKY